MNKRRAYLAKRLLENEADTDIDDSVLVFFEKVGLMVERGFLDIELIDNVLGFDVHNYWQALQHYIDSHRRSDHTLFIRFEKLKNDLDKYAKREYQNYEVFRNTPVKEFLRMESRRDVTNMKFIPDELETTTKSRKKTKT